MTLSENINISKKKSLYFSNLKQLEYEKCIYFK